MRVLPGIVRDLDYGAGPGLPEHDGSVSAPAGARRNGTIASDADPREAVLLGPAVPQRPIQPTFEPDRTVKLKPGFAAVVLCLGCRHAVEHEVLWRGH
jgi:hypothetical protein